MKKATNLLLLSSLIERTVFQGIYPVLPVIVASVGASKKDTGLFMAIIYGAIFLGSVSSPKIFKTKYSIIKTAIVIALMLGVAICLMGSMKQYSFLLLASCLVWFLGGVQQNTTSVMMTYITTPKNAGINFGKLGNTVLIGTVVGGFLTSLLFKVCGQPITFIIYGVAIVLSRFLVLLIKPINAIDNTKSIVQEKFKPSKQFLWLVIAVNIGLMLAHIARFCLSLLMKEHGHSIESISANFGWGALIALPLPYLYGRLSQLKSNRLLLFSLLISIAICMLLLFSFSNSFSFLIISFLISVTAYCSKGVTQKIVYKLYPITQQINAQSNLATTNWIAAIFGFTWVSFASDIFTLQQVSIIGFVLAIIGAFIIFFKLKVD